MTNGPVKKRFDALPGDLYVRLFHNYPGMLCVVDGDGDIIDANMTLLDTFKYDRKDIAGKPVSILFSPSLKERLDDVMAEGRNGGHAFTIFSARKKNGDELTVEVTVSALGPGEDCLTLFIQDITERLQADETLKKRTEEVDLLYEAGRQLNRSLDLNDVYTTLHNLIKNAMDCDALVVSSYNPEDSLIRCEFVYLEGKYLDHSDFPPIPLEPEGKGKQSRVIRTGEPILFADYESQLIKSRTSYYINLDGRVQDKVPEDADRVRSAIMVPMKLEGDVVGVIHVQSYRLDAYTGENLKLLEALALQLAAATANAKLYDIANREIDERRRAEAEIEYINSVLMAIRNVSQLIIHEKSRDKMIQGTCDTLIETRGYGSAWMGLTDGSGNIVMTAEAGIGKPFKKLAKRLAGGELCYCARQSMEKPGTHVIEKPSETCGDCPLSDINCDGRVMFARLEHAGKNYGLLVILTPEHITAGTEEKNLLEEVTGDIAFALHGIEVEEEHGRAEQKMRESEKLHRNLVESVEELIWELDADGVYTYINTRTRHVYGLEPEEVAGKTPFDFMPSGESERVAEIFEKIRKAREPFHQLENLAQHKDGRQLTMLTSGEPFFAEDGTFLGYRGMTIDFTDRVQAERLRVENLALQESNKMKNEFVANMSHDLRTPLNAILGYSELLQDEAYGELNEKQIDRVGRIYMSGESLLALINDILDLSKIDAGKLEFNCEELRLDEVLNDVRDLNMPQIQNKCHELKMDVESGITLWADEQRLKQCLNNFLGNAVKFTPDGGNILVEAHRTNDMVEVSVTDNGRGIPAEHLDDIFQPFYRLDKDKDGTENGTGLGLPISRKVIEAMGGSIRVESEAGRGSRFIFTLHSNRPPENGE